MARLFTDGAEMGDMLFWSTLGGNGTAAIYSTPTPFTGNYCYGIDANTGNEWSMVKTLSTPIQEFYYRFKARAEVAATVWAGRLFAWRLAGTELGAIKVDITSTYCIQAYRGTWGSPTILATGTIPINSITSWYTFEVYVKIAEAPDGIIQVKIDGVQDINFTGDTSPSGQTTVDSVAHTASQAALLSDCVFYDDIAMNDTTGASDNSWCGDGRVILLKPNANGDVSQLVGQDGNSADNYLNVDEIPTDSDTTYNQGAVSGEYDLYNLEASGLNNVSIQRGWIEARARKLKAVDDRVLLGLKTGGTEYWNDNHALMVGSYSRIIRDHKINPISGSAWTVADLDALQVGMKVE